MRYLGLRGAVECGCVDVDARTAISPYKILYRTGTVCFHIGTVRHTIQYNVYCELYRYSPQMNLDWTLFAQLLRRWRGSEI